MTGLSGLFTHAAIRSVRGMVVPGFGRRPARKGCRSSGHHLLSCRRCRTR
ncbi:hypothetical protein STVIR_4716 [Streptomyces viridochromogenes Tue57]|uniref:Uncharacterized protein n=1 Tax=Streptomyces viridochromogenes Tue57 TaxID=1160705 RepID=L8PCW1_STRVR|nr:hypothetical protein STVIR_4716 [Streptomyces viridochromogenes Tue57]